MTTPGRARRLGFLVLALWGCQGRVVVPPSGQTSGEFDGSAATTAVGTSAQPDATDPDLTRVSRAPAAPTYPEGTLCNPLFDFEGVPAGYENVGMCGVP